MSKGFGLPHLITRLLRDEEGSYLLYMTVAIPVFIGFAGLATEGALLFYNHRTVQSAADAAAYSAAIAYSIDSTADITTQAEAIVADYGFWSLAQAMIRPMYVATVDTTTYSRTNRDPRHRHATAAADLIEPFGLKTHSTSVAAPMRSSAAAARELPGGVRELHIWRSEHRTAAPDAILCLQGKP